MPNSDLDRVGPHSRLLLAALDIDVTADGRLSGNVTVARAAVETLLANSPVTSDPLPPLTLRLRQALQDAEPCPLNHRDYDALAVVHNRLFA